MSERAAGRLSLRAIEIFVAAVEEQSLGRGAQRLGASASSVSQHISNLEDALGTRLIDRTARPLTLTQAGKLFHPRSLAILDEIGRARAELARLDVSSFRELTLAVIEELEPDILPSVVTQLASDYTTCNFIVRAGSSHHNIAALESRTTDLIVTADTDKLPDWVERHDILRDPLVLVSSRKPDVIGPQTDKADLLAVPMIRFTREQILARQIDAHLRRVRLTPARRFEVENNRSMMAMIVRERGWGITTALGYLSTNRFHDQVAVSQLPFAANARDLMLCARRDVLGLLPAEVASAVRDALNEHYIPNAEELMPWLGAAFYAPQDA